MSILPSPWQEISHANPIFCMVEGIRYGFLGVSDASVEPALGITAALAAVCFSWSVWLFRSGHRLKP